MGTRQNRLAEAVPTGTHNLCFTQKYEKYHSNIWKVSVFGGGIFYIFEKACFRNECYVTKIGGGYDTVQNYGPISIIILYMNKIH